MKINKKGFTLIEVLIGLGIVGVITIFTLPTLNSASIIRNKSEDNTKIINYSSNLMENLKKNFYEDIKIDYNLPINEKYDYEYNIIENEMTELELKVWRKTDDYEIKLKVLLPRK